MISFRSSRRLAACGIALSALCGTAQAASEPSHSAELDAMIIRAAQAHGVPERLVRRVVMRESRYNPRARNHSFWGLMQISYPTARSMGFKGSPEQLLNPLTNLTYAVPYLANAFIIAGKREDAAVRLYASGYYASAKNHGLVGALRTADSAPVQGAPLPEDPATIVTASYQDAAQPQEAAPQFQQSPQAQAVVASSAHADSDAGGAVEMTKDRHGRIEPPRKWMHDGGMTTVVRGEQGIEKIAAYRMTDHAARQGKGSHGHDRKNPVFAAIEAPPASAQAYAADAGQAAQLAQSASQAAIAQATAGTPAATDQQGTAQTASDDPKHKHRRHHASHRSRHEADASAQDIAAEPAATPAQAPQ